MQRDEVIVRPTFFEPLTPLCADRPRCQRFQKIWTIYMGQCDTRDDDYIPRIVRIVLLPKKVTPTEVAHSARVMTSIAVWFGTNIGFHFMENLLNNFDPNTNILNNMVNVESALKLWSVENSLYKKSNGWGGRTLQHILQSGQELHPLTAVETDSAEKFIVWLASKDGRVLLNAFKKASDRLNKKDR